MVVRQVVIIAFVLIGVEGQQNCNPNWFGPGCRFQCHCAQGACDVITGACPNNVACAIDYFGPACQYQNLLSLNPSVPNELGDNNDSTCSRDANATEVTGILLNPILFEWLRVYISNKDLLTNFTVKLNGSAPCTNERRFVFAGNIVDTLCDLTIISDIRIEGAAVPYFCSVYVSAGRNVALKESATQTSTGSNGFAEKAVDGSTNSSYELGRSCTHTAVADTTPAWTLTYSSPAVLYNVLVYNRNYHSGRLVNVSIQGFDESNIQAFSFVINSNMSAYYFKLQPTRPVTVLTFNKSVVNAANDTILTLCEVETFGDLRCPPTHYGLLCNQTCSCKDTEMCFFVTGSCIVGCPEGFYGSDCSLNCSNNCQLGTCAFISGKCDGCKPGYQGDFCEKRCDAGKFGSNCSLNCPKECTDICNSTSGRCADCPAGFYGTNCTAKCSQQCEGSCDIKSGNCLKCAEHHQGPNCTDCAANFYGPDCKSECSTNCESGTCDKTTGQCSGCRSGFHGQYCAEHVQGGHSDDDDMPYSLFAVPIVLLVLASCILLMCLRKRGEAATQMPMEN